MLVAAWIEAPTISLASLLPSNHNNGVEMIPAKAATTIVVFHPRDTSAHPATRRGSPRRATTRRLPLIADAPSVDTQIRQLQVIAVMREVTPVSSDRNVC